VDRAREDEAARKDFAGRLNAYIECSPLSRRRLAKAARVSPQSITDWTRAKREPNLRQLRRLSVALEVPLSALVEDQSEPITSRPSAPGLLDELVALRLGPAVQQLGDSAPTLLALLSKAERVAAGRKKV
jgi:transcriptional regulator with XRE-family HTH domain